MNPLDQFGWPLIGPPRLSMSTTYPGKSWFTEPRPYTAQLPSDGRPMNVLPVFIMTSAEPWAWLSVWQERTTASSSACSRTLGK